MTAQRIGVAGPRPLEILGIGEAEERVYRWLLNHPRATTSDAAQALTLSSSRAQRLLDAIEAKGLTTRTPEHPRRYIPASPDIALNALMFRRQESLQRAAGAIQELQEQAATRKHGEREQVVELITSREAETQIYHQIHRTVRHEIVTLMRPPALITRFDVPSEQDQYHQREAQTRGVRFRSIVDPDWLSLPRAVQRTKEDMKAGEDVRVLSHLPFKMLISDRRIALIPLNPGQPTSPTLLVRTSALLDALYALFEIFWERATPISFTRADTLKTSETSTPLSETVEDLLSLMAAGLNDKKIAHELGISLRTLYRRIAELMGELDARTRFQFGWLVALRLSGSGNRMNRAHK